MITTEHLDNIEIKPEGEKLFEKKLKKLIRFFPSVSFK